LLYRMDKDLYISLTFLKKLYVNFSFCISGRNVRWYWTLSFFL